MVSLHILKSGVMVPFPHMTAVSLALKRPAEQLQELREEERAPIGFALKCWLFLFSLSSPVRDSGSGSIAAALPGGAVAGSETSGLNGKISNLRL